MKMLFAPGIAVIQRLSNEQKLPLLSLVYMLPLAVLYYETHSQIPASTAAWVLATLLFATYCMAAFYFQADAGWALLISVIRRVYQ